MRIGIDAGCLGVKDERLKVGVYTVVKNMLLELSRIDKANKYLLYSFYPIERELLRELGPRMKNIVVRPARGWLAISLPIRLLIDRPDVFIAANQAMPHISPFLHIKKLGVFYDIAFEKYPELYSYAASVVKHKKNSRYLAKKADRLITISQNTKKDLVKFYNVSPKKIDVAYPGVEKAAKNHTTKKAMPYFLFVGAFKKSKNIPMLLTSFANFLKKIKTPYNLYLVGGDKWLDPEIEKIVIQIPEKFKSHIHFLGFIAAKRLHTLYRGATAFISPSLYEGFGLPFVEAQSFGCPVIGSTRGSLPEIIGDSGILIDPLKPQQLTHAMERLTEKKQRAIYSRQGIKNARKYTWKIFAKQVQSALNSL